MSRHTNLGCHFLKPLKTADTWRQYFFQTILLGREEGDFQELTKGWGRGASSVETNFIYQDKRKYHVSV